MTPRLSGPDVLKFIRSKPALATVRAVVLTNTFVSDLARAAASLEVAHAVTKGECTPVKLLEIVRQLLAMAASAPSPPDTAG